MRHSIFTTISIAALLVTPACASSEQPTGPMADAVTVSDQWAGAAETGMTAVFGSVTNAGDGAVRIVGGSSPQARHVEIHEVVPDDSGAKQMRQKDGGLTVTAGETRELIPGGDHLMLMDLTQPLHPGADVEVTLEFDDGSTLPITAQVREFAGGNEEYSPGGGHDGEGHHHG